MSVFMPFFGIKYTEKRSHKIRQGTLTEDEGSIQFTSSLRYLVSYKK
jgi:hypothetical protein